LISDAGASHLQKAFGSPGSPNRSGGSSDLAGGAGKVSRKVT
jgi:hypothetical protein